MSSVVFRKADKLFWHDKIIEKIFLWAVPGFVYPNYITIFRFLSTPFVFWLFWEKSYFWGLIVFLIVAFTDVLDGSLARTRNQITDWGISYDPIADKILISGSILILVAGHLGNLISVAIIGLELIIVFNAWLRRRKGRNIQANLWGKIKMFLHVCGVSFLIIGVAANLSFMFLAAAFVLWLAVFFAFLSLVTGRL